MANLRFLLDEHLSPEIAVQLRRYGVDCLSASDAGLLHAADIDYVRLGIADQRVVVTSDKGFLKYNKAGTPHSGIIFCSQTKPAIGDIVTKLIDLARENVSGDFEWRVEFI